MNTSVYKSFCKVCQDAGKSEAEYTSHNVREPRGTQCPTLLAQECRNCYKRGHTIKYCPSAKAQTVTTKVVTKVTPKVTTKTHMPKNVFMILDSDSEDEKEEKIVKVAPTPVLNADLKANQKRVLNFKSIISLTEQQVQAAAVAAAMKSEPEKPKKAVIIVTPTIKTRWADAVSDSSGDEEDEYYEDNSW